MPSPQRSVRGYGDHACRTLTSSPGLKAGDSLCRRETAERAPRRAPRLSRAAPLPSARGGECMNVPPPVRQAAPVRDPRGLRRSRPSPATIRGRRSLATPPRSPSARSTSSVPASASTAASPSTIRRSPISRARRRSGSCGSTRPVARGRSTRTASSASPTFRPTLVSSSAPPRRGAGDGTGVVCLRTGSAVRTSVGHSRAATRPTRPPECSADVW